MEDKKVSPIGDSREQTRKEIFTKEEIEASNKRISEIEYLKSIPGMVESILKGKNEPIENCKSIDDLELDL